jgi:hypothetical protein
LRYHTSSQLGQLLRELRENKGSHFGQLTYHLATALFFTGCRYDEWALLRMDRLVREPAAGRISAGAEGDGFIKTGHTVVGAPAWKDGARAPGPVETSQPGIFAAR